MCSESATHPRRIEISRTPRAIRGGTITCVSNMKPECDERKQNPPGRPIHGKSVPKAGALEPIVDEHPYEPWSVRRRAFEREGWREHARPHAQQNGVQISRIAFLITTTRAGKLQMHIFGAIAEFERARIAERVRAGLARVRARGGRLSRPPASLSPDQVERTAPCRFGSPRASDRTSRRHLEEVARKGKSR